MNQIISETLYRKYRPQTFEDILGQSEVVTVLQNSLKNSSISHAYLFSGIRGTGKTSIARIFATELGTSPEDLYEIDAASNRGINEIRELRAGVDTRPFNSAYKVYIIDEVHMLTKEAANALLKTLEEPPSHVIFILATTEKHKMLDTIISRCQVFDFNRPSSAELADLVTKVAKSEKRKIDEESVKYIAELGNGSFRDTLSHLQSVFSFFPKDIKFSDLSESWSISDQKQIQAILTGLNEGDKDTVFAAYHQLKDSGTDITQFVTSLLEAVRTVLLLRYSPSFVEHKKLEMSSEDIDLYQSCTNISSKHLQDLLSVVSGFSDSAHPDVLFELYLFELFKEQ